jgi:hypothetical protein
MEKSVTFTSAWITRSFVNKAKEGGHVRIKFSNYFLWLMIIKKKFAGNSHAEI